MVLVCLGPPPVAPCVNIFRDDLLDFKLMPKNDALSEVMLLAQTKKMVNRLRR